MDVLDWATSSIDWFLIAIFAQALFHWRDVDHIFSTTLVVTDWGCFRVVTGSNSIWTFWSLMLSILWVILFIHLAWTTLILFKDRMRLVYRDMLLSTSAYFISVFRCPNSAWHLWSWILSHSSVIIMRSTSSIHFIWNSHHPWAIITKYAAAILHIVYILALTCTT